VGQRQEAREGESRRRSESHSPSGRLFSSTFASRAKKSEASIAEETGKRAGSRTRDSRTPSRSRANSVSREPVRRRSTSKTPGSQQHRSFGNFADNDDDGLEDVPDPFLAYKSFAKFKESQDGSYGGYQSERSERSKSKVSTSDSSPLKKISESFASSKISDTYNSSKLSSSGLEGALDNFDYKFSSTKLSDLRNSGVFSSSTPKYGDTSSTSSYLSRTASSSMFSGSDSGYGGLSKRNSGAFSSALDSSFSSSRTSPETSDRDRIRSDGKISLGSLKQASVENWESQNSAILRRGVSSTYIG